MSWSAGLLALALLAPQQPRTYYWRDAQGQTHITNTPPPPDGEVLDAPPPVAVESSRPNPVPTHQDASRGSLRELVLSPAQQQAWSALDQRLARARAARDRTALRAILDSLVHDCLWGNGLWLMPLIPVLSIALMGLLGWWLALGHAASIRPPLMAGSLLLGVAFGHLLLTIFLYHPQATRLRQNLELLEYHTGAGRPVRPELHSLLQTRYQALDLAADPLQAPWRFPAEVRLLRETMGQVLVDP
ncbi:MAG TPA: DUF4124 domain-containing protein [Geothrix sp.]|nr:DUF4124 domain-containing protein [Geothrix sp.]